MKCGKENSDGFILGFMLFCLVLALTAALIFLITSAAYRKDAETVPTSAHVPKTVIIDAGHGGEDGGAVGVNGTLEKDVNLDISKTLADMLKLFGYDVIMTRTEDILLYDRNADYKGHKKSLDLRARLEIAKKHPDAPFVSIHMNSFGSPKYSGLQVYYSKNAGGSRDLAECIQSGVRNALQADNDRKIKPAGSSIYLLDRAPGVAVLAECGFLSNAEECSLLSESDYRKKLSFVLSLAVSDYLDGSCEGQK